MSGDFKKARQFDDAEEDNNDGDCNKDKLL